MSGKKKTEPVAAPEETPTQNVVQMRGANLPAQMMEDVEEYAGAGTSDRREDNLVPFLYVAQKGSPQVNKRDAAYIEGLEAGMVFDTATRQIWDAEHGAGPLLIQAWFEPCEVEWGLRDTPDKGYKGRHPADTPLLSQIKEVPKQQGRGVFRMLPNGHQLTETKMHYFILAEELRPVAFSATSSAIQASKALNFLLRSKKVPTQDRRLVTAQSFASIIKMHTRWRQDGEYDWFVPFFEVFDGWCLPDYPDAYEEAKILFRSAREGALKVATPVDEEPSASAPRTYDHDPNANADPDANPADGSPI